MTAFAYSSGDPNNLVGGGAASMGDIQGPLVDLRTFLNGGNLDGVNLTTAAAQALALNVSGGNTARGKSIIATTESRTNVAYGTLPTPDQVSSIVLPANGLIHIGFMAAWQETVSAAARAAIFIGANQLKSSNSGATAPTVVETSLSGAVNVDSSLASFTGGLISYAPAGAYTGDVTTGQLVGQTSGFGQSGLCTVFAAAGTYSISVQFKASSGTVTVKQRKLWVKAEAF